MLGERGLQLGERRTEHPLPGLEHHGRAGALGAGDLQMQHPSVGQLDQSTGRGPALLTGVEQLDGRGQTPPRVPSVPFRQP
jgi:hypothetical protein